MKNIESVEVVFGPDIEAIYVNGKMVKQGSSLGAIDLFNVLIDGDYIALGPITERWIDEEWLEGNNYKFPEKFKDIPKKQLTK